MRYLSDSDHGWLGGLGFAAASLNLADRDQWIGWEAPTRAKQLHRVVGMSRFLIRQSVRCQNLASRVLDIAPRGLAADFEAQYGYRPWLVESFVDTEQFLGTCYQAANQVAVGHSQGLGRQDRTHAAAKSVKTVYVYALEPDFGARMWVAGPLGRVALEPGVGLDGPEWAQQELGGADLGDQRLNQRLWSTAPRPWARPRGVRSVASRKATLPPSSTGAGAAAAAQDPCARAGPASRCLNCTHPRTHAASESGIRAGSVLRVEPVRPCRTSEPSGRTLSSRLLMLPAKGRGESDSGLCRAPGTPNLMPFTSVLAAQRAMATVVEIPMLRRRHG
jgi:hypothetical protein